MPDSYRLYARYEYGNPGCIKSIFAKVVLTGVFKSARNIAIPAIIDKSVA